jgi:hypothetical protein
MSRWIQASSKETPKFSVIVFEYSPSMSSSCADGSSPFLKPAIVGSDSSSATQGSSMANVAGKNLLPMMQWALAEPDTAQPSRASTAIR